MTPRELFEYAEEHGFADAPIRLYSGEIIERFYPDISDVEFRTDDMENKEVYM